MKEGKYMFEILEKRSLNPTVTLMRINAPKVAKKAEPGQFIILRTDEDGERIPLTIADFDRESGSVTIIFQIVGATTEKLNHLSVGDELHDFVGPLGKATETEGLKKVAVVGGGVGCAIALPIAQKLHEMGENLRFFTSATRHIYLLFKSARSDTYHKHSQPPYYDETHTALLVSPAADTHAGADFNSQCRRHPCR